MDGTILLVTAIPSLLDLTGVLLSVVIKDIDSVADSL